MYLTLCTSMFSKYIHARYDFDHFGDLVLFKAPIIFMANDGDKDIECKMGCYEDEVQKHDFMYWGSYRDGFLPRANLQGIDC